MICRQIDTRKRYTPVPISFLICSAKNFDCDIHVQCGKSHVDVKNYDDMIRNLKTSGRPLMFFFNGRDEIAAQKKIERIFQE